MEKLIKEKVKMPLPIIFLVLLVFCIVSLITNDFDAAKSYIGTAIVVGAIMSK